MRKWSLWSAVLLAVLAIATFVQLHPRAKALASSGSNGPAPGQLDLKLPLKQGSVRFAVIGDSGTGEREQFDIAEEMEAYRQKVKFDFVIMLGDNIYGGHDPSDFARKFEQPYKPMLDAGVKFYASLGNHDDPDVERLYKPFNMNGQRYYVYKKGDVALFALDSNYMNPEELDWLKQNLSNSQAKWKIAYFHHPLFNDGRIHGSDVDLRSRLVPLFKQYNVNAVFSGHEHSYERVKPQEGIYYFVLGSSGKLAPHDFIFKNTDNLEKAYDEDRTFMLVEIAGDQLYYQTIARKWRTVDAGMFALQPQAKVSSATASK